MIDGQKDGDDKESPRKRSVSREEQGDLLADAVTGLFSPRSEGSDSMEPERTSREEVGLEPGFGEEPADSQSAERLPEGALPDPAEERESERVEGGEESVGEDAIPDSPWEQKMAWAKARVKEGRLEEAEELYRELVEDQPKNVRALNNLGVLLDEMGDAEGAVAQLRAAKEIEPRNQEVLGNLGAALGALGRYAEAEEELRVAYRADPSNLQIRANLGILLFRRGLYEQAVHELESVCSAQPDHRHAFFYKGEALNRLGKVDEAIEALERVTELVPENPKAYYTLGVLFDKKNLPERAAAMYRKARDLSGS
jgi:Flp pilus assembly protein TadD